MGCAAQRLDTAPITAPTGNQFGTNTANTGQRCVNEKTTRTAAIYQKLGPFPHSLRVFELIAAGTSLREPYPASSTAIRAQFAVAGCSGDAAAQAHPPTTARAQVL